jgi:hypothetical protein
VAGPAFRDHSIARSGRAFPARVRFGEVEAYIRSHQIVSSHLTPHASIGLVQRSAGYSEYVIRETGQVIGEEEAGVAPLWQGLLSCDHQGRHKPQDAFWQGWEERYSVVDA